MKTTDLCSSRLSGSNPNGRRVGSLARAAALPLALLASALHLLAAPVGSAFNYQGRLTAGGLPANGGYDLRFTVMNTASGGNPVAAPLTNTAVPVRDGLFTVALDFGSGVFNGEARWLEIAVRTNGSAGPFAVLAPLQPVAAAPYSQYALKAAAATEAGAVVAGAVGAPQLATPANPAAGQVLAYTGTSLAWADAGAAAKAWLLAGNSGVPPGANFLGTTDNQPLELRAYGQRALRLEPGTNRTPNVIGGSESNYVAKGVTGGFIGGGNANAVKSSDSVISGGAENLIATDSPNSAIGGGYANWIGANAFESVIAGGNFNEAADYVYDGFIGGGYANYLGWSALYTVIGGGVTNTIGDTANYSFIGGGANNTVGTESQFSVIAGGEQNLIGTNGLNNTVAGGGLNEIRSVFGGTVGGGYYNLVGDYADYSTVSGGYDNVVADSAAYATIPGGQNASAISYGQLAYASGSTQWYGDAQSSLYVLRNATTNAAQAELFLDGTSQRMVVPEGGTWTYHILLVARSTAGNSACYEAKGGVKNVNGTLSLVGATPSAMTSLTSEISSLPAPRVQADTAQGALLIRVTGVTAQTIYWVARVQTVELIF